MMHGSATLAFGDLDDFQTAMEAEELTSVVVTQHGRFQAFLTQVSLHSLRLSAITTTLPCVAFVRVPDDRVLLSFSTGVVPQIWAGMSLDGQDLVIIGPRQGVHTRLARDCHWANIWIPTKLLIRYGRVVSDNGLRLPTGVNVWRPPRATARKLRDLHSIAIRAAHARSSALTSARATHGLEQQVLDALLPGLSERPLTTDAGSQEQNELMARLEDLLSVQAAGELGVAAFSGALGVSAAWLRRCCAARLGMSLADYLKVRRLQSAHGHLRRAGAAAMRIADIAKHHGFADPGRFAGAYRDFFGELPSDTLRRTMRGPVAPLTRGKGNG